MAEYKKQEEGQVSSGESMCVGTRERDFDAAVERKNGVDELVETVKDRTRFENELIRGQQLGFFAIVVEDQAGFEKIVNGNYRSQYDAKALQASLAALSLRYGCPIHYLPAALSPGGYTLTCIISHWGS